MHPHDYQKMRLASLTSDASVGEAGPVDEVLLTAQQVCRKLGGISQMTLWRWLGSDAVQFPQPTLRVNKRRFWSAASIKRWLAERCAEGRAA